MTKTKEVVLLPSIFWRMFGVCLCMIAATSGMLVSTIMITISGPQPTWKIIFAFALWVPWIVWAFRLMRKRPADEKELGELGEALSTVLKNKFGGFGGDGD